MNILILSCSTGEGHNSAAKALVEECKKRNIKVYFKDALSFGNYKSEKIVKSILNNVAVKTPSLFGIMYKAGSIISNPDIKSPIYFANKIYAENMYKYILKNKIDKIICTHLFPMETLTYLKLKKNLKVKCYGVLTDYTTIPFIEETLLDGYVIPHESLIKTFENKKINKDKLLPFGIPVSSKFNLKYKKIECRTFLKLPLNKKIILIMTGGEGCGNIIKMLNKLLEKIDNNVLIIVLTGKNKELYKSVKKEFSKDQIIPISFTKKVELYMDASDILLSKPGGLSSTEACVKNIPLIHTMPIPGCETENALFFSKNNMSIKVDTMEELVENTIDLLNSNNKQKEMLLNQKNKINKNTSKDIINFIIKKGENNEI